MVLLDKTEKDKKQASENSDDKENKKSEENKKPFIKFSVQKSMFNF